MKKLTALLMALLMVATMMTTAMADTDGYDPVVFPAKAIKHTLALTASDMSTLPYTITYTFENEGGVYVVDSGFSDTSAAVTGSPTIGEVVYTANQELDDATNKSYESTLEIDWSKVKITEPGVYRWKFIKKVASDEPNKENLSNNQGTLYLYAYVTVNGDALSASVVMNSVAIADGVEKETKVDGDLEDSYPAKVLDLSINKTVTGNQASKNQYFQFKITMKSPAGAAAMNYSIDYTNATKEVPATAYNAAVKNPDKIVVPANNTQSSEHILWLKAGETVKITGLLYNTSYTITEVTPDGYQTTSTIDSGDTTVGSVGTSTVSDETLTQSTVVKYNNHKDTTVPTGIDLQTSAPTFGLLMAMAMMFMAFAGKRKEQMI